MKILADTHIHFYPFFDFQRSLSILRSNLACLDSECCQLGFLAERFDCNFFTEIQEKKSELLSSDVRIKNLGDALLLQEQGYNDIFLFAGRQIVTRERLEILALTTDTQIPDGLPVQEVIERINAIGAIAVLSWAPGKWFFDRGKKVKQLLDLFNPQQLLLGDTTLRPWCWTTPILMKKGVGSGYTVLAGSDPLPFVGEEKMMGRYASYWQMELDFQDPVKSVRKYLKEPGSSPDLLGKRGGCVETLMRLYNNWKTKNRD